MNRCISFIMLLAYFCSSCSKPQMAFSDAHQFLSDSCVLKKAKRSAYLRFIPTQSEIIFFCIDTSGNFIYKYNNSGEIVDSVLIPSLMQGTPFGYSICEKSIFYLVEHKNLIIEKYPNGKMDSFTFRKSTNVEHYLLNIFFEFENYGDKFVLLDIPNYYLPDKNEFKAYFQQELLSVFTLEQHKIKKIDSFGKFPNAYRSAFFYSSYPIASGICNNVVAYIFNNENVVNTYNVESKQLKSYQLSDVSDYQMKPFDFGRLNFAYTQTYRVENPIYECILYDSKTHHWLLMQTIAKHSKVADGFEAIYEDKPLALYVLDSNFNTQNKILFNNANNLNLRSAFFFNHKLYIATKQNFSSGIKVLIYDIE